MKRKNIEFLAVILLIITHIYLEYSIGILYYIMLILVNTITANTFMILMGIGMKYSRHHEPKNYILRGIILLTLSQYLNLIRNTLPNLIAWWTTGNKNFISRAMLVLQADILSFAGFAFMFLGVLKKMKLSDTFILIIGIILNICDIVLYRLMRSPNIYNF